MRNLALLMRLDRPVGIWLVLLPALWAVILASGGARNATLDTLKLAGICLIGAVLVRAAGCIVNDLWDQDLDAHVERTRTRPLASGAVSRTTAKILLAILLAMAAGLLPFLPLMVTGLAFVTLALIAAYPYMKRITYWPQLFLGLTFNMGVLIAWAMTTGGLDARAFFLYAAAALWTLAYDTIYAHQDIEDDRMIGIKSTALLFGEKSFAFISACYAAMIFILFVVKPIAAVPFLLLLPTAHIIYLMKKWQPASAVSSLAAFKANTLTGVLVLLYLSF